MSAYSDTLLGLARAVGHLEDSTAKWTTAARDASLKMLGEKALDDLSLVRGLCMLWDGEDAHHAGWSGVNEWLAACEAVGFRRAYVELRDGGEVVMVGDRAGIKRNGVTTLAPR